MKIIDYEQLQACLYLRIPPADFMAHDCSPLLDEEIQAKIARDLVDIAATNSYYVRLFLARYVRLLELKSAVIDELYELYCEPGILSAQELPPTAADVLTYSVDSEGAFVAIRETPRIISGAGTTGLRTWEAALFLLNYLNNSPTFRHFLKDKRVLELGTGTGLVSLALLNDYTRHQFKSITLTDGDSALLEKLPETFKLNKILSELQVDVRQLIWGEEENNIENVDVLVAADVTYDSLVVPQLCITLARFFTGGATVAYVAATIRNEATIEVWESELNSRFHWNVCEALAIPHQSNLKCWFRQGTPEIRVYEITGNKHEEK